MKNTILNYTLKGIFLFFLVIQIGWGQTNSYVPKVIPPSPNAASLGKFGDIPVSYYTGLANTSIPIYTISSRDISLPISLSYHHGGIKVEEEASNVGLGWSLNAGGVITRTIRGLDDLRDKGITFHPLPANPEADPYFKSNLYDPLWGFPGVDTEPDIFYYNIGGQSGKFVLENKNSFPLKGILLNKGDVSITCKLISNSTTPPGSNPTTTPPGSGGNPVYQWEVITGTGIKYTFAQQEITSSVSATTPPEYVQQLTPQYYENNLDKTPAFQFNSVRNGHLINSWYLTQIYSPTSASTITLNYDNSAPYYSTSRMYSSEVYQYGGIEGPNGTDCVSPATLMTKVGGFSYSVNVTRNTYLKSIVFDNGKVEFELTDREDIQQYYPDGNNADLTFPTSMAGSNIDDVTSYAQGAKKPQKIQSISIKDASNALIKKFNFSYSYFNSSIVGVLPTTPTAADYMKKYNNLRLRLDKVQESDNTGNNYLAAHQFRYTGDIYNTNGTLATMVTLPSKTSWAKDYYGYYNGKTDNNSTTHIHIIPKLGYPKMVAARGVSLPYTFTNIGYGNTFDIGIDRDVDTTFEANGALSHIYYPTGGYTKFDYGFHKAKGDAEDVDANITTLEATAFSTPAPLIIPTGDNNKFYADLEFKLTCSSYTSGSASYGVCSTSNSTESFDNIWYAKIQSNGNVFRSQNYSDWVNKNCTVVGNTTNCSYTLTQKQVLMPTGTYQLSINSQIPTNTNPATAFTLPGRSVKMTYYKYNASAYKEIIVGGLRINKITDYNGTEEVKARVLSYSNDNGTSTGKQLRPALKYIYGYVEQLRLLDEASLSATGQGWSSSCPKKNWAIEMNANSLTPLGSASTGTIIGYDKVTVSEVDANNQNNGQSIYQYHNQPDIIPTSVLFTDIPSTPDLANGMLTQETVLDKNKQIKQEIVYTISNDPTQTSYVQGMQFLVGGNLAGTDIQLAKGYYKIPIGFWFTSSKIQKTF